MYLNHAYNVYVLLECNIFYHQYNVKHEKLQCVAQQGNTRLEMCIWQFEMNRITEPCTKPRKKPRTAHLSFASTCHDLPMYQLLHVCFHTLQRPGEGPKF